MDEIYIHTPYGNIVAERYGNREIGIYLERIDGEIIDLANVEYDKYSGDVSCKLWEDTTSDTWTKKKVFHKEDLMID